jgi:transcriptional regulator
MIEHVEPSNFDELDRNIMKLRALGFKQEEIALHLNISQASVSQRLEEINIKARKSGNFEKFFWEVLLGGSLTLLGMALSKR